MQLKDNPWDLWEEGGIFQHFVEGTVVPKALLPAIGYVNVAYSELDIHIDHTNNHLLGIDRNTGDAIAAAAQGCVPRLRLMRRLVELRILGDDAESKETRKKLDVIAVRAIKAMEERNRLIHDYVASYNSDGLLNYRRKEVPPETRKMSAEVNETSLKELGNTMIDLSYRLQRFRKGDPTWKQGAQFPLRDKPQAQSL